MDELPVIFLLVDRHIKLTDPLDYNGGYLILQLLFKMKNLSANPVKRAASLILCRAATKINSFYDYQILMLERKESMKSFASMFAFPGGKYDSKFDEQLAQSINVNNTAIATAIRQCFQQTGIYLAQNPLVQTSKISDLNQIKLEYIASQFFNSHSPQPTQQLQKQYNTKKQLQIFNLYKRITQIAPPKTNFTPFIRLVTVPIIKSRFDAQFYFYKVQDFKLVNFLKYAENQKFLHSHDQLVINGQSASFGWFTPIQVLKGFVEKKIKLAPPQFIMLNIMSTFHKYQQLQEFLNNCSQDWINMSPNIVSMINNNGYMKQQYPFAAALIGDLQFPYQFCKKNQKNQYLIEQIAKCQSRVTEWQEQCKNRLLFKKPLQFFEDDYSSQCTIPNSVMSKFMDSKKLKYHLDLYQ